MTDDEIKQRVIDNAVDVGAELMRNRVIALLLRDLAPTDAQRLIALVTELKV